MYVRKNDYLCTIKIKTNIMENTREKINKLADKIVTDESIIKNGTPLYKEISDLVNEDDMNWEELMEAVSDKGAYISYNEKGDFYNVD